MLALILLDHVPYSSVALEAHSVVLKCVKLTFKVINAL